MVMLMLIQFDAYLYEITDSFRYGDSLPVFALSSESSQMAEDNEAVKEWSDPYYRNAGNRLRFYAEAVPVLIAFFFLISFGNALVSIRRFSDMSRVRCVLSPCLFFCVLLI